MMALWFVGVHMFSALDGRNLRRLSTIMRLWQVHCRRLEFFGMLNDPGIRCGPQEFSIADQGKNGIEEVRSVKTIIQHWQPHGSTLAAHLIDTGQWITLMEGKMSKKGLELVVIIASDHLPTSPEGVTHWRRSTMNFIHALQHLQSLPIWVVICLCTDEQAVVTFTISWTGFWSCNWKCLTTFSTRWKTFKNTGG
jgi:hypothetical protein